MRIKYICSIALLLIMNLSFALDFPLAEIPQLSISISGYVENPGTYKVYSSDRLSDALLKAESSDELGLRQPSSIKLDTDPLQKLNPIPLLREEEEETRDFAKHQALRHIVLMRGGQQETYDLLRFYRQGDISQNPLLRDGDIVHVPVIEDIVSIRGAVAYAGDLEYKQGDTVGQIIDLALGTLPGAELSAVRLNIYQGKDSPYQTQILNLVDQPQLKATAMYPGDLLMIPINSRFQEKKLVNLSGRFVHQGEYILAEDASLWDAIQMAGGVTEDADLANAVVLNHTFNAEMDPEFERLKLHDTAEMSPIEYAYFRSKLRQARGRYSVDFARVLHSEGKEGNIILNDGDYIYLPQELNMVRVSGQVKNPGLIPFQEGKGYKYYVKQAGGYASNRNYLGIRILNASSGNWEKARKDKPLKPGDMIFVPDKLDRSFWIDLKDIVSVAASAITILIGVQSLTK
ncbi:MAG: SLBB domain-containing protein [Candidatus Cloacimonadaceae bacterium]|nr:SLBB domain-containing protein [Candidatus Cloacimonadota bacterium]MCK9243242.1 SLBB domain-containing protein [Candidatus Cloacimonadota bacterium]MDY0128244.1 SLBB domain-containing protein [Candidatus Cloacimonadaceae bacterium]